MTSYLASMPILSDGMPPNSVQYISQRTQPAIFATHSMRHLLGSIVVISATYTQTT